jgi:galactokinase
VPLDLAGAGLALLVVDTRVKHSHADGEYASRRAGCEEAAAALGLGSLRDVPYEGLDAALAALPDDRLRRLTRHVVTENQRVERVTSLLLAGDAAGVGPELSAGHASLRDDFRVSCPELDLAVETAVAAGALGARMTGGGFGGSAIALTPVEAVPAVSAALASALPAAHVFPVAPAPGAHRLA